MAAAKELRMPTIAKLRDTEDYKAWATGMSFWLKREKRWGYVTGCVPAEDWDPEVDEATLCDIGLMVDPSVYVHLHDATTAADAWNALAKAYAVTGVTGRFGLMSRLYAVRLDNFKCISDYLKEIMNITQQLASMGKVIDDEDVGFIMLNGLPKEYRPMVLALGAAHEKVTSQMVKDCLLGDEQRDKQEDSTASALWTRGHTSWRSKGHHPKGHHSGKRSESSNFNDGNQGQHSSSSNSESSNSNSNVTKYNCGKCGKIGHKRKDCPVRQQDSESPHGSGKKNTTFKAMHVASIVSEKRDHWVIDSGCDNHMSNRDDWMLNYNHRKVNIAVANDSKEAGLGVGDVVVHIAEGTKVIEQVLHVPGISTNLLSVSKVVQKNLVLVFTKEGCSFYHMNDFQVSGEVRATASLINGLFVLDQKPVSETGNEADFQSISRQTVRKLIAQQSLMCLVNKVGLFS